MPEYGRHVHEMVQHAVQIEDREQRNNAAYTIVGVMGCLTPHLRDVPDFKQKLWNHLLVISDFKLDIDAPYPILLSEMVNSPHTVPYPHSQIRQRHYGKILVEMIRKTSKLEDCPQRDSLIPLLVSQMRKSHTIWSRSELNNEQIIQDVFDISDGNIKLNSEMPVFAEPIVLREPATQSSYGHGHGHGHGHSSKKKKKFKRNGVI